MNLLSNIKRNARTWLFVLAWLTLLGAFWFVANSRGVSPLEMLVEILQGMQASPYAVLWLVLIYAVRPLFLLPVSVLTVFAGFLFGPWQGLAWSVVASVATAALAYGLARLATGTRALHQGKTARRLRENAFEAVLTMRLAAMPGDPINFLCGALRVPIWPFLTATAIGGLPGVFIGVFAGASLEGNFSFQGLSIRWEFIVISAVMLVAGLLLSRWLRKRGTPLDQPDTDQAENGSAD